MAADRPPPAPAAPAEPAPRRTASGASSAAQLAALARAGRLPRDRALLPLPRLPDEAAVLRAVRLRLQPADRLCRAAELRPCRLFRHGRLHRRPCGQGLGAARRSSRSSPARAAAAVLGLLFGWLAIRRAGIYFAMITLALAQMVYFFCVQAPFTGGEDGIQAIPRGKLFGIVDAGVDMSMYWLVAGDLPGRLPADPPHHPFALRPGAEGDPRERAARDLARLPDGGLQADGLRAVGDAGRRGGRRRSRWSSASPR